MGTPEQLQRSQDDGELCVPDTDAREQARVARLSAFRTDVQASEQAMLEEMRSLQDKEGPYDLFVTIGPTLRPFTERNRAVICKLPLIDIGEQEGDKDLYINFPVVTARGFYQVVFTPTLSKYQIDKFRSILEAVPYTEAAKAKARAEVRHYRTATDTQYLEAVAAVWFQDILRNQAATGLSQGMVVSFLGDLAD